MLPRNMHMRVPQSCSVNPAVCPRIAAPLRLPPATTGLLQESARHCSVPGPSPLYWLPQGALGVNMLFTHAAVHQRHATVRTRSLESRG